ncbi:MAG: quinone-dependent dihydroorotate dehydrogenase [Chloroflexota bacterium]|nr:quinone-dependent dihydroorotate dehydrogenase [Chloroflexota bacterium]
MYSLLRPVLFSLSPERAHHITLQLMRLVELLPPFGAMLRKIYAVPVRPVLAFGLTFPNIVGLAAGYDKDGIGWHGLTCLGFGHIEIGTVTPRPQPGNPKPRLFRLPRNDALINRMGFPGKGATFVANRIRGARPKSLVIGVNIGKNADKRLENAVEDYLELLRVFEPLADYVAINVSSPNTVGLRRLQVREALLELLTALDLERRAMLDDGDVPVPMLVKLSPDLTDNELEDALDVLFQTHMDGVIVSNTTVNRDGLDPGLKHVTETGGLSGAPLGKRSTQMIERIYKRTQGDLPIIGVGGIMNSGNAKEKLDAGATLVQVYTGLVYAGPGLVREIVEGA